MSSPVQSNSVAETVRTVIAAMAPAGVTDPTGRDLDDATRLREDLSFESVRLIELTMVLERTFDLPAFAPEELAGVLRVGDVVDLITRTTGAES